MLIDPDLRPQQTVYHTAGIVLGTLQHMPSATFDLATVYDRVLDAQKEVSAEAVVLALDFLYLLGLIGLDERGELTCI